MSLNQEPTYSGYSSEANINSQANKLSEAAIKSANVWKIIHYLIIKEDLIFKSF